MWAEKCVRNEVGKRRVRRRDFRIRFFVLGVFAAVFFFTFLTQSFKKLDEEVGAASLANFDPGYIMSDYQMGNYNSMSEAEIQAFLTAKNSCPNTNYDAYLQLSANTRYKWHWKDGHFVCLSEELFGDGEVIGSGDTAAHIIWQAAQDYRINPQVLLVLLQKETGLITDTIPNDGDYRKATGYGCPDTAPCSSQYYGFKNQIRKAAALFRTVLDGGWTNYPLGENYVQYNPDPGCGGSVVNIRSLATSALYRYTPYQPNAGALAAGYGTAYCGAYGNRNFYLYFEDWFGGIKDETVRYVALNTPRYMEVKETTNRIDPRNGEIVDEIAGGRILKFMTKTTLKDGRSCLRTEFGTKNKEDICIPFEYLKNVELKPDEDFESGKKIIKAGAKKVFIRAEEVIATYEKQLIREIAAKIEFNGKTYYITEFDCGSLEYGFEEADVEDVPEYQNLDDVKMMTLKQDSDRIDPITGGYYSAFSKGNVYKFASMIVVDGLEYYRTEHNTVNNIEAAVLGDDLVEVNFVDFSEPRYMRLKNQTERINPATGEVVDVLQKGRVIKFTTKILINDRWYYRTEHNTLNNLCMVIDAEDVEEIEQ